MAKLIILASVLGAFVMLVALPGCVLTGPRKSEVRIEGLLTDKKGKPIPRQDLEIFFPEQLELGKEDAGEGQKEAARVHLHRVNRLATDQNGVFRTAVQYPEPALYFAFPPLGYIPAMPDPPQFAIRMHEVCQRLIALNFSDGDLEYRVWDSKTKRFVPLESYDEINAQLSETDEDGWLVRMGVKWDYDRVCPKGTIISNVGIIKDNGFWVGSADFGFGASPGITPSGFFAAAPTTMILPAVFEWHHYTSGKRGENFSIMYSNFDFTTTGAQLSSPGVNALTLSWGPSWRKVFGQKFALLADLDVSLNMFWYSAPWNNILLKQILPDFVFAPSAKVGMELYLWTFGDGTKALKYNSINFSLYDQYMPYGAIGSQSLVGNRFGSLVTFKFGY